jgi:NAD(P)-dependent dehydrogenase (short-subunit alcohol dehydrogenase family)
MAGDATRRADVEAWIAGTVQRLGRLDVLVCSAGLNIKARALAQLTPEDWSRLLAANLDSAFHCTQAALEPMRRQGGGLIVYISSISARYPDASGAGYQAAKHGLTGLANAVRWEEQRHGIRTTLIYPGVVNTPLVLQRPVPPTPEQLAVALQPEDVAAAVAFVVGLPDRVWVPELEMRPVTQM